MEPEALLEILGKQNLDRKTKQKILGLAVKRFQEEMSQSEAQASPSVVCFFGRLLKIKLQYWDILGL